MTPEEKQKLEEIRFYMMVFGGIITLAAGLITAYIAVQEPG